MIHILRILKTALTLIALLTFIAVVGTIIYAVSYTHLTLPTIYSV